MKVVKIITIALILILIIFLGNKNLFPKSKEIDDMEISKFVGLDYDESKEEDKKATISYVINKEEGEDPSGSKSSTEKKMIMSYSSTTFNNAIREMQFYTDKVLAGSHVYFFVIGEKTAKDDIDKAIDELSKSQEIRLSTHIYLIKDITAYDFLNEMISMEYDISDKLRSMEKKGSYKTISKYLTVSDLLSDKLSDSQIYLIPALKIVKNSEKLSETKEGESSEETQKLDKQFNFYGYGIMKANKLIDYINEDESIIYNMLINESQSGSIDITNTDNKKISFGINDIVTTYKYEFDKNDNLKNVNIKISFISNFEETHSKEDISTNNSIEKFENLQEEKIKKQVEEFIQKTKNLNMDILNISKKLELVHPYKFRKNKDKFKDNYKDIDFKIQVESKIETTYDIIKVNK